MPTYDYKCLVCDHDFETIQSIKDDPHTPCPQCKIECYNRLISGCTAFVLKGGGWAADNYGPSKKD